MSLKRKLILSILISSVLSQSATAGITEAWRRPAFYMPMLVTAAIAQIGSILSIAFSHSSLEKTNELRDATVVNSCGNDQQCFADRAVLRDRTKDYQRYTKAIYVTNALGLALAAGSAASWVFIGADHHRALVTSSLLIGSFILESMAFGFSYTQNVNLIAARDSTDFIDRGDINDLISEAINWSRGAFYPMIPSFVALFFHTVYNLVAVESKYFAAGANNGGNHLDQVGNDAPQLRRRGGLPHLEVQGRHGGEQMIELQIRDEIVESGGSPTPSTPTLVVETDLNDIQVQQHQQQQQVLTLESVDSDSNDSSGSHSKESDEV